MHHGISYDHTDIRENLVKIPYTKASILLIICIFICLKRKSYRVAVRINRIILLSEIPSETFHMNQRSNIIDNESSLCYLRTCLSNRLELERRG